jgi:cytochrome oxidase Cu insertion factor (SCO1/SenC/PrrC family)
LKKQQVKNALFIFFALVTFGQLAAQHSPSQPPYLRFPIIPQFTLITADSGTVTKNDLKKNRNTLLMYFSPTCDHCQVQTDSMVAEMSKLKDVQILMATYSPISEMKAFYEERALAKYGNILMGYDSKYFFPPFYKMGSLPFMALYDKKGNFITSFHGNTSIDKIVAAFARN